MPSNPFNSDEYAALPGNNVTETSFSETEIGQAKLTQPSVEASTATLKHYLLSIIFMPFSLRIVCLTNLFCWMAHVSYSLYFTDFVGEAVFGGDPKVIEFHYTYIKEMFRCFIIELFLNRLL